LTSISPELDGKRLELLREVVPKISHVAVLWNPTSPLQVVAERETQAGRSKFELVVNLKAAKRSV
jgi:putative tryptophan/tyrosine transport system substrate-binding protein